MKKTIAILLSASCLLGLNSCFKQEDDLFNESAAQRLNHSIQSYQDLFCSAQDGWVLEYFANSSEQGYPIMLKFDKNSAVTVAGNNSVTTGGAYKEESSTYEIIGDTGPVLSFNTYNNILGGFADPEPDGLGHEGDYEFQLMGISENQDTVYLQGKKHGLQLRMVKFPKGFEYTTATGDKAKVEKWEDYYTAQNAVKSRLFNDQVPLLYLTAGNEVYQVSDMNSGVCTFLPVGGDELTQLSTVSYYLHLDGSIELAVPYSGINGNFSVQNFKKDSDKFVCVDENQSATLNPPTSMQQILNKSLKWRIDGSVKADGNYANMGGKFVALYKAAEVGAEGRNRTVDFNFTFDSKSSGYVLNFNLYQDKTTSIANFYIGMNEENGNLVITGDGEGDKNSVAYSKAIPALKNFMMAIPGSYKLSSVSDNPFIPILIKFESVTNPSDWFVVTLPKATSSGW